METSSEHLASRNSSTQLMIDKFVEEKCETTDDPDPVNAIPAWEAFKAPASFPPSPHIAVI